MALLDALLRLSNAQPVTATAVSTNTIDLLEAKDLGWGEELDVVISVDEAAVSAGATTVTFEIITSSAADLGTNVTVVGSTAPIGKAELTIGRSPINVCLNPANILAQPKGQRYLGVRYTVAVANMSAGKFTAYLTNHQISSGKQNLFPSGFSVG